MTTAAIFDHIDRNGLFEKGGQRVNGLTSAEWTMTSGGIDTRAIRCSHPSMTITLDLVVTLLNLHGWRVDVAAGGNNPLAGIETSWYSNGLDGNVYAFVARERHHFFYCLAINAAYDFCCSEARSDFQSISVSIYHDDLRGSVELRGEECCQTYRSRSYNRHRISRFYLAV